MARRVFQPDPHTTALEGNHERTRRPSVYSVGLLGSDQSRTHNLYAEQNAALTLNRWPFLGRLGVREYNRYPQAVTQEVLTYYNATIPNVWTRRTG